MLFLNSPKFIYVCTRMVVRKKNLIQPHQYHQMLNMDLNQIVRVIGEMEYGREANNMIGSPIDLLFIEEVLWKNLDNTHKDVIRIIPPHVQPFFKMIMLREDIRNVMAILRAKEFGIEMDQIRRIFSPVGMLSHEILENLVKSHNSGDIVQKLKNWEYYPVLQSIQLVPYQNGTFADLENLLYRTYFADVHSRTLGKIQLLGGLNPYIRFEIDILNLKNIYRILSGSTVEDIRPYIIPGGNITGEEFQLISSTQDRDRFIEIIKPAKLQTLFSEVFEDLDCDPESCEVNSANSIWKRWYDRKIPIFLIMVSINRIRLRHMNALAKRYPFSILPILSYLEHKRYEVMNLQAIARGRQFDQSAIEIKKYLVM